VPESQSFELRLLNIPVQWKVADAVAGEDALHEMVLGFLITLPMESRIANGRVQVGVDPTALAEDGVLVAIPTGHPLSDDDVLLEILNRFVHEFIVNTGFAQTQTFENQPLPGTGLEVLAFVRFVSNDGDPAGPVVRVEPTALPNHYDLVVPLEIWANIEPPNSDQILEHLQFEAELRITTPILRNLNPPEGEVAGITIALPEGEAALTITNIIEGQQALIRSYPLL